MPPPLKLVQLVQDAGVVLVKGIAGTPASSHRALAVSAAPAPPEAW